MYSKRHRKHLLKLKHYIKAAKKNLSRLNHHKAIRITETISKQSPVQLWRICLANYYNFPHRCSFTDAFPGWFLQFLHHANCYTLALIQTPMSTETQNFRQFHHHHRRRLHRRSEVITTAPTYTTKLHGWPSLLQANTRTRGCSDRTAAWLTRDEAVSKIVRHTRNRNPLGRKAHEPSYQTKESYTAPQRCFVPLRNTANDNMRNHQQNAAEWRSFVAKRKYVNYLYKKQFFLSCRWPLLLPRGKSCLLGNNFRVFRQTGVLDPENADSSFLRNAGMRLLFYPEDKRRNFRRNANSYLMNYESHIPPKDNNINTQCSTDFGSQGPQK